MMPRTTDTQYADLLARLQAMPSPRPVRREQTQQQARAQLVEDLIEANGAATW